MTKDEARKFFLKGYERGVKDMIAEVLRMTSRGYGGTELSVVLRSKAVDKAVEAIDRKIEEGEVDLGMGAPTLGRLRGRGSYLVREAKGEQVFALVQELAAGGARPLCISRTHPDDLAAFGVAPADVVWLSRQVAKGVRSASPADLVGLTSAIHRHLDSGNAVLAVEGLDYLVSQNSFASILRFVQTIHEKVVLKESYFLLSANPDAMKESEYRQLAQTVTAEL